MKLKLLILLALCLSTPSFGWTPDDTHRAAHFGVSYAMNNFVYGLAHNGWGMSRGESLVFSTFTSLLIGFIPEYMEAMQNRHLDSRALLWNGLGNTAAVGTTLMFEF